MLLELLLPLVSVWILWLFLKPLMERRKMPPGPFPIPFLGNLLQTGTDLPYSLEGLRKKYGDLYTVTFPIGNVVLINNFALMKEALVTKKNDFAGRSNIAIYPLGSVLEHNDIVSSDFGPKLMFRRKIFKTALHIFGEGANEAEMRVTDGVLELLDEIESTGGKPISLKKTIEETILIVLWKWLANEKCSYGDSKIEQLFEFNHKTTSLVANGNLHKLFPFLKYFPSEFHRNIEYIEKIKKTVFEPTVISHEKTYKDGVIRDITDSFLYAIKKEMEKSNEKDVKTTGVVKCLLMDAILGGADTTSTFFNWFILYMILFPDLQKKIQDQLDSVVGRNRLPSLSDIPNMHWLQAAICEALRHSSFLPIAMPHKTTSDTSLAGYEMKKDTIIFVNLYCVNRDPAVWENPHDFQADRFIDEEGKFVGWSANPGFAPFALGRRYCIGESLAKLQINIVASFILHRFRFETVKGEPKPTLEVGSASAVRNPKDYKCIAIRRE